MAPVSSAPDAWVVRFDRYHRITHAILMASFLGLAATGLPLLFSDQTWARWLSRIFGGFGLTGTLHRIFAVALIGAFLAHVARAVHRIYVRKDYSTLWGPSSMVPQPRDVVELYRHVLWFLRRGPRPAFDHFTYWEKFDYWAVFWGMFIIGGSGLMLWFPTQVATVLPGWVFNIALLVHGEEALLAVGFIFTVHFFNGHLRPEKFPMDLVIFTGRISRAELEEERAAEYARLAREQRLASIEVAPPSPQLLHAARVAGTIAVTIGVTIVGLIMYAVLA